jgi:hypothetical protein
MLNVFRRHYFQPRRLLPLARGWKIWIPDAVGWSNKQRGSLRHRLFVGPYSANKVAISERSASLRAGLRRKEGGLFLCLPTLFGFAFPPQHAKNARVGDAGRSPPGWAQ